MISCLRVRNLAIVRAVDIEFVPGLNVLTGQTGAGKSILIMALGLVLGGRGRGDAVRSGCKQAEVEALVEAGPMHPVRERLAELGQLSSSGGEDGGEIVIRRVLFPSGRTRAYVNGRLVGQKQLQRLALGLADISSQHEHHSLTSPETHLRFVDAFGSLDELRQQVAESYQHLLRQSRALTKARRRLKENADERELLSQQLEEIGNVAPAPGEDHQLEAECQRLRNSEQLTRLTSQAALALYDEDGAATERVSGASQLLQEAAHLDDQLSTLSQQLQDLGAQLEDLGRELGRHLGRGEMDPGALEQSEARLFQLCRLKHRYGGTLEAVLSHQEWALGELEALDTGSRSCQQLESAQTKALTEALQHAQALGRERRRTGKRLGQAISAQLRSLGMGDAEVRVELLPTPPNTELPPTQTVTEVGVPEMPAAASRLTGNGMERAEFLIAANLGEPARPLREVASGGELSRALLAIKCVLAAVGPSGMYVFDEVDSGVGGAMGEVIGRKIRSLSRHRQVLCITHLPQIAVFADQHLLVRKTRSGQRTVSSVRLLSSEERSEEIARMLGGAQITHKTRAAAHEMLTQANGEASSERDSAANSGRRHKSASAA